MTVMNYWQELSCIYVLVNQIEHVESGPFLGIQVSLWLPVQWTPSVWREYPSVQAQVKCPSLFTHSWSQGLSRHSFTSIASHIMVLFTYLGFLAYETLFYWSKQSEVISDDRASKSPWFINFVCFPVGCALNDKKYGVFHVWYPVILKITWYLTSNF